MSTRRIALPIDAPNYSSVGVRRGEPVTVGVPLPRGLVQDISALALRNGWQPVPVQAEALDRWPDGSVRWALLDFQATLIQGATYQVCVDDPASRAATLRPLWVERDALDGVIVDTGAARFTIGRSAFPFVAVAVDDAPAIDARNTRFEITDTPGHAHSVTVNAIRVEVTGPLRARILVEGTVGPPGTLLTVSARLEFFAGSAAVRFALTLRNSKPARHAGGRWELGDPGSVFIRDAALHVRLPDGYHGAVACSEAPGQPLVVLGPPFELYQDSSGGAHWDSRTHVNRAGVVPNTFRGYRLRSGAHRREGLRATPIVTLRATGHAVSMAMPCFWQNCPKAIEATPDTIVLRLFPRQYADAHEIQGGEQKTHRFTVAFGEDPITDVPLDWCRTPLHAHASPEWVCETGAVRYLTSWAQDPDRAYLRLLDAAIEGGSAFERKREIIDEYGWRHFGDLYADHEARFWTGSGPLVSHYNNQYDAIAGFGRQYLRSGDPRWWRLMDDLAAHVVDIDVYRTDRDKAAYNGGLFWHTAHYVDAATSSHRSYPRGSSGGGLSAEHNYTTGLTLHYFLTGDPISRDTAIGLARWVIDMDDGRRTTFRWLARGRTGLASATADPGFHGPGRGPGHSIVALLDGHQLTGDRVFLDHADELVRRCIHPDDDQDALELLDAERRWSYTAFLQALARYLDDKAERGELDEMYAYGRAALLNYARWMADHERPYLDHPERLEYPTETWVAQELRKSDVFVYAARHAPNDERPDLLERADFFFRYAVETLSTLSTRTCTRPLVLLLTNGYMRAFIREHAADTAPAAAVAPKRFPPPIRFVPQKTVALRRAKVGAILAGLLAAGGVVAAAIR